MRRIFMLTLLLLAGAGVAAAQVPDTVAAPPDTIPVLPDEPVLMPPPTDTVPEQPTPMSAGGAFLRSLVIPGWGQAAFGAYTRGGIYFAGWTGNWFMNVKNHLRLQEARNRFDLRTAQIRDELIAAAPNPDSMRAVLDTTNILFLAVQDDPIGGDIQALIGSREQQREDWIAWSVFWLLASGIDAFVTAHLSDFPATIDVEPNMDRSVSFRVGLPLPRRRP